MVGPQSTGKAHLQDCPTWLVEMGCTGKGKGMNRTFSQLQAVPQLGGPALLPQSPAPSFVVRAQESGCWYPRLLEGSRATGSCSLCLAPPFSDILWLCQGWGSPRGDVAALRGALCCCACRWQVTLSRQGTGLAWGTHCSSPCLGGSGPPKCQGASKAPERVCSLGVCMSLDPSHCGCEKDVCPWGCWQAGWVSLPQLGQQGPAHLTTGTQSSSREPRC